MQRKNGFTLIELLVVLSIIMMLMMLVIPNVTSKLDKIRLKGCEAMLKMINTQIQLFELNEGYLPSDIDDLVYGNYIDESQTKCPNGNSIYIKGSQAYCE